MKVFVDDRPYTPAGGREQTLGQLAQEVGESDAAHPRLVVNIHCDGQPLPEEGMEEMLARPIEQFDTLELITQPLGSLVAGTLAEASARLAEADAARGQIAGLLTEGKWEPAFQQLQTLFAAWRQVQEAVLLSSQALNVPLDELRVEDRSVAEVFDLFKKMLGELKDAMVARDLVLVADILQYEFETPFACWRSLVEQLQQRTGSIPEP